MVISYNLTASLVSIETSGDNIKYIFQNVI